VYTERGVLLSLSSHWGAFDRVDEPVTAWIIHTGTVADVGGGDFVGGQGIDPVAVGGGRLDLADGGKGGCWRRGIVC
jgi:hypothetical protein